PAESAIGARGRLRHGGGVEVFRDLLATAAAGRGEIADEIGKRVSVAAIGCARRTIAGTENGEGPSGLQRHDAAHLPASKDGAEGLRLQIFAGQFPDKRAGKPVRMVGVRQSSRVIEVEGREDGAVLHIVVDGVVIDVLRPGVASKDTKSAAEPLVDRSFK